MDIKIEKSVQQKESQEIDPPHICTTFFFFWLFRAAPMAYGSSQARSLTELKPLAYATATATPDLSHICHLHHSSLHCRIFHPVGEARDPP